MDDERNEDLLSQPVDEKGSGTIAQPHFTDFVDNPPGIHIRSYSLVLTHSSRDTQKINATTETRAKALFSCSTLKAEPTTVSVNRLSLSRFLSSAKRESKAPYGGPLSTGQDLGEEERDGYRPASAAALSASISMSRMTSSPANDHHCVSHNTDLPPPLPPPPCACLASDADPPLNWKYLVS